MTLDELEGRLKTWETLIAGIYCDPALCTESVVDALDIMTWDADRWGEA